MQIIDLERTNDRNLELQKKLLRQKDTEMLRGAEMLHALKEKEHGN